MFQGATGYGFDGGLGVDDVKVEAGTCSGPTPPPTGHDCDGRTISAQQVCRPLYHGVRLRQREHTVVISRSTATHAEHLPIEPRPTAHTMSYRRESSRLHIVQPPLCKSN